MPTYEAVARFWRDYGQLTAGQQRAFRTAVRQFVADLRSGRLRKGLRVKRVQGAPGVFEMTWAPDGRTTFEYGPEHRRREPHIVWRRIGMHTVLHRP